MKPQRLDKLLAAQSKLSRKEVKALCKKGAVALNGTPIFVSDAKIDIDCDEVTLYGKPVCLRLHLYLMMNKPKGVVSATRDPKERTVLDLIPPELLRDGLFPAGRLDKDTVGFVLLTDDGDFAHRILSPKNHIPKTYLAELDKPVDEAMIREFEAGFSLSGADNCKPAELTVLETGTRELVQVVLHEGMYHQIKRMFRHFDRTVLTLRRIQMGGLFLDKSLQPGQCRELTAEEVNLLEKGP